MLCVPPQDADLMKDELLPFDMLLTTFYKLQFQVIFVAIPFLK